MLSFIICSISFEHLKALEQNIQQTVGVKYEVIAIDNREKHWPIAKVYNYGAQQAKYPYLLFLHEDVRFHSANWGQFIIHKLAEPDCGAIGFAGSKIKLKCYSGWYQFHEANLSYLYQGLENGKSGFFVVNAYLGELFEEVVTLDGLAIFVRRELWEKFPFDEQLLTGFHCYDVDFSLQLAKESYKNYVCCSNQLLIEHFSMGNFKSKDWLTTTIHLHQKWKDQLPMMTTGFQISEIETSFYEEALSYDFLKRTLKSDCESEYKKMILKEFYSLPFSWKHFRNCISGTFKYIKYG